MRFVITAIVTALIAALAFSAKAESASKKKQRDMANKKNAQPQNSARNGTQQFGYDATPEHYPVGSREWWRAMEREGRGGSGDNM